MPDAVIIDPSAPPLGSARKLKDFHPPFEPRGAHVGLSTPTTIRPAGDHRRRDPGAAYCRSATMP